VSECVYKQRERERDNLRVVTRESQFTVFCYRRAARQAGSSCSSVSDPRRVLECC